MTSDVKAPMKSLPPISTLASLPVISSHERLMREDEPDSACDSVVCSFWSKSPTLQSQSSPSTSRSSSCADVERARSGIRDYSKLQSTLGPSTSNTRLDDHCRVQDRARFIFSVEHLYTILRQHHLVVKFREFLVSHRPPDVAVLQGFQTTLRILNQASTADEVLASLRISHHDASFADCTFGSTDVTLERQLQDSFRVLHQESFPAYLAYAFHATNASRHHKVMSDLAMEPTARTDDLVQMFCVTDPNVQSNPIIFASRAFSRKLQYSLSDVMDRAVEIMHGSLTDHAAVQRLTQAMSSRTVHSEVILYYSKDGSPFLCLETVSPMIDSRGRLRYWLRCYVDCSNMELEDVASITTHHGVTSKIVQDQQREGRLRNKKSYYDIYSAQHMPVEQQPSLPSICVSSAPDLDGTEDTYITAIGSLPRVHQPINLISQIQLPGVYHRYLLIRPTAPFRILFSSPAMQMPALIQAPFMSLIGGDRRVRAHLEGALTNGSKVTAKITWLTAAHANGVGAGRTCWAHCTPLLGDKGEVGVWMVLFLDEQHHVLSTTAPFER